jgi:hypothetical protein
MYTKLIIPIFVLGVLGACSPGQVELNKGQANYAWVGCHVVTQNPASSGEWATSVHAGDLPIGSKFYLKQVSPDGTVGPVTTGEPCNQFPNN